MDDSTVTPSMKPTLLLLALTTSLFDVERPAVTVPRQTSSGTVLVNCAFTQAVGKMSIPGIRRFDLS